MILDIHSAGGSDPDNLTPCKDLLFFSATDGEHGTELWFTDGTTDQTKFVLDIYPGTESSEPEQLICLDDWLLFVANDGMHGKELWRTNGEVSEIVKDIHPGENGFDIGLNDDEPRFTPMKRIESTVYFVATDIVHGLELWKSDGTPQGTAQVDDDPLGSYISRITLLHEFDGRLYAVYNWKFLVQSDGTAEGTLKVPINYTNQDQIYGLHTVSDQLFVAGLFRLRRGTIFKTNGELMTRVLTLPVGRWHGAEISDMTAVGDLLYFKRTLLEYHSADDWATAGSELWRSDGTSDGTVRVTEGVNEVFGEYEG